MPSIPSLRNPFRKSAVAASPAHNNSTDSFASSTISTSTETSGDNGSRSNIIGGTGKPYLSITPIAEFPPSNYTGESDIAVASPNAVPVVRQKAEVEQCAGEYKLSVVNDSGVYLPPSPTEKKSFWKRSSTRVNSPIDRTSLDEPFTISRESFESYRRSFDISARSPVLSASSRTSLDSRTRPSLEARARSSFDTSKLSRPIKIEESAYDGFEDIKLDDGKAKKRGIFSRFASDHAAAPSTSSASGFGFKFGAKKDGAGDVAQESELKSIPVSKDSGVETIA